MGKAIVYAVMGLITIGLMIAAGLGIKFLIILFLGRKKKREQDNSAHWRCYHPGCTGHQPGSLHKHN